MRTLLAVLVLAAAVVPVAAGPTPAQKCTAGKMKAGGKNGQANGVCAAKASQAGLPIDAACLVKADDKLTVTYDKAELKGGCVTAGDAGAIAGLLDGVTTFAVDQLGDDGSDTSRKCGAGRRKATGKYVGAVLKCHAKAASLGTSVDGECLAKAEDKLSDAFDKAEAASGSNCDTLADSVATRAAMDAIVGDVLAALAGGATTTTTTTSTTTTAPPAVHFAANVQPILTASCTGCHGGGSPSAGLNLTAGVAYASLVSVPSGECAPTNLVDPGSPGTSYLVHKLAGSGPCFIGNQMPPPPSGALSATEQQTIADWIALGALND